MRRAIWLVMLWAAGVGGTASGQSSAPSTAPDLGALVQGLGADDYRVRQAAQRGLEQVPLQQRDTLKALADRTEDPEVKARLLMRVEEMDDELAISPPPISVSLKDASLTEVAAALSKAAGGGIEAFTSPRAGFNQEKYTLEAEQPFWEIVRKLDQQHGLALSSTGMGMRLIPSIKGIGDLQRVNGFAFFVTGVSRATVIVPQAPGRQAAETQLVLRYTVAGDPRIRVQQAGNPQFQKIVDDKGNTLTPRDPLAGALVTSRVNLWPRTVSLALPEGVGSKIVFARGEAPFSVRLQDRTVDIVNPEKHLNETITLPGNELTLTGADVSQARVRIVLSLNRTADAPAPVMVAPVQVALSDATGKRVGAISMTGGTASMSAAGQYTLPITVRVTAAAKVKTITVPFELKDIPLP